jgi:hypothetical protein
MAVDPVWVLLDPKAWLDDDPTSDGASSDWEKKLLGAVVRDFYDPRTRQPNDPSRYCHHHSIITRELSDFVLSVTAGDERGVEATLTRCLGARVQRAARVGVDLAGKAVTFRRLDQDEDYWETVRRDVAVQRVLPGWLKKAGKTKVGGAGRWPLVCLVTGIGVCQGVEFEWETTRIAERRAHGEIPLDAVVSVAAGSPLPVPVGLDVKVTLAKKKTDVVVFKAKGARRSVFALELKVIQKQGWVAREIVLGGGPKIESGHQLGDSDEDDGEEDIDVEELVLHTLPTDQIQPKES